MTDRTRSFVLRLAAAQGGAFALACAHAATLPGVADVRRGIAYALESWFVLLPIGLAVAVALSARVSRRDVLVGVAATLLVMLALDFAPSSSVDRRETEMVFVPGEAEFARGTPRLRWYVAGAFPQVARHLAGEVPEAADAARSYTPDSPRYQAGLAYLKVAYLLMPFTLAGMVLGATRSVRRSMLFTRRSTELVTEFLVGWVLPPVVVALAVQMSDQTLSLVLFEQRALTVLLVPFLTLATLSLPGWWAPAPVEPG